MATMLSRRVLSKEEEHEATDAEVTKEDQEKINKFSRLHNRSKHLDEELVVKQKDKDDLTDLSLELDLADEEQPVTYKIGESFFEVSVAEARELVEREMEGVDGEVAGLEEERDGIRVEVERLKAHLYARFGRGINLEA